MKNIKIYKLSFLFYFLTFANSAFCQELKAELYVIPFSVQFNKVIETGTPIGEFNLENIHTYEVGAELKYKLKNNFGLGIGVNYNQISYKFDYLLTEPNSPFLIHFSKTNFNNNVLGVNPMLFYEFKKLSFALSYELNTLLISKGMIMNNSDAELGRNYTTNITYGTEDNTYGFSEKANISSHNYLYSMSKLMISYKFSNKFTVFGGIKYKILGDRIIYDLGVSSDSGTPSAQEYNVQVINQPLFLQAGFSYNIKIK